MAPTTLVRAMPRSRRLLSLLPALSSHTATDRLTPSATVLLAVIALFTSGTTSAEAHGSAASETPLHLAVSHFEFVASGTAQPPSKPLRVHNGGTAGFTNVRLTRVAYADSPRGAKWLVAVPRQTVVAPDELATVATLCVDATGLPAGTYRATAAVVAREVPEPVAFTVRLVVTDAGARASRATVRCGAPAATK